MDDAIHMNDALLLHYLDGEMNPEQKAAFERQLQQNNSLREQLESLRLAVAAVNQYGVTEKVKSIHAEMIGELGAPAKAKVMSISKKFTYALAAAASIIAIIVGINLFTASRISSEKLYEEAFVDYDASAVRGQQSTTAIQDNYQRYQYSEVVSNRNKQKLSSQDSLLIGLSYLKLSQLSDAVSWLQQLTKSPAVADDGSFYLSLALLKEKNYTAALQLMRNIRSNPSHIYHDQFSQDYIDKVEKLAKK